jgi:RNA polymerase sigma factor (sigma-70 family)
MKRHTLRQIANISPGKKNYDRIDNIYRTIEKAFLRLESQDLNNFVFSISNTLTEHSVEYRREIWLLARRLVPISQLKLFNIEDNIDGVLSTLPPRYEKLIRLRFGIGIKKHLSKTGAAIGTRSTIDHDGINFGENGHSLEELASAFGVDRERIRQMEAKIIRMLRHDSRSSLLIAIFEKNLYSREIEDLASVVLGYTQVAKLKAQNQNSYPMPKPEPGQLLPVVELRPVFKPPAQSHPSAVPA